VKWSEGGKTMPAKIPNPVDKHVGSRVRLRRMILGLSQEKLGEAVGLTFQQIQKYEKGANRIGASRLQQISGALGVPVAFFFEGLKEGEIQQPGFAESAEDSFVSGILTTNDGLRLVRAFLRFPNQRAQRAFVDLAESIAENGDANIMQA
jgi:transcriptional regulator with XRE-family HTH domain